MPRSSKRVVKEEPTKSKKKVVEEPMDDRADEEESPSRRAGKRGRDAQDSASASSSSSAKKAVRRRLMPADEDKDVVVSDAEDGSYEEKPILSRVVKGDGDLELESDGESDEDSGGDVAPYRGLSSPVVQRRKGLSLTEYVEGSIRRVKLHNFVTYDDVEFFPGPRLNVVVAPNGAGKSSLVCAFALGLAGSPNILGRAKKPAEFIKQGRESATIEIELYRRDPKPNLIVTRFIDSENNTSFRLNGKKATLAKVRDEVKALGVQVDNLCQFLPQDRVAHFSALTPEEMLRETERAVSSDAMVEDHERLISLKEKEKRANAVSEANGKVLAQLKSQNNALERIVESLKQREELTNNLRLCEDKLPWCKFEASRDQALRLRVVRNEAEAALQEFGESIAPLVKEEKRTAKMLDQATNDMTNHREAVSNASRDVRSALRTLDVCDKRYATVEQKLDDLQREEEGIVTKRERLAKDIAELLEQLKAMPEAQNDPVAEKKANERARKLRDEVQVLDTQRQNLMQEQKEAQHERQAVERRLLALQSRGNTKLNQLRRADHRGAEAYQWVSAHAAQWFEGRPFYHVAMDTSATRHAAALEDCLPAWLLRAFVVSTAADRDTLVRESQKAKIKVSVTFVPNHVPRPPLMSAGEKERLGIVDFLSDVIEAPPAVLAALLENAALDKIAVLRNDSFIDGVLNDGRVNYLYTPTQNVVATRSRYGNRELFMRNRSMQGKKALMLGSGDVAASAGQVEELQERIRDVEVRMQQASLELEAVQDKGVALRKELTEVQAEAQSFKSSVQRRIKLQAKIDTKRRDLSEATEFQGDRERQTLLKRQQKTLKERVGAVEEAMSLAHAVTDAQRAYDEAALHRLNAQLLAEAASRAVKEASINKERLDLAFDEADRAFLKAKDDARTLKTSAIRVTGKMNDALREKLAAFPDDVQSLEEMITVFKTKLQLASNANPQVLTEYTKRKGEIQRREAEQEVVTASLEKVRTRLNRIRARWEPPLEKVVEAVNEKFSKYMEDIGCAGEVNLVKDEDDFAKWRVEIRVKFREASELAVLNAAVQSGGERSVSTMLYVVAMQDLTECPFRLVDEINQGMDPRNERAIFAQVVRASTSGCLPQFFLVTPKLLPDLKYDETTTVLAIFNGPYHSAADHWDMDGFIKALAARIAA
jgi:chromosome segregation ATPase